VAGDEGSDEAFAAFFDAHRAAAYRKARGLVDNHEVAEDVVAEAFSRMWRSWREGAVRHPPSYLARTVHNACMDHFRRQARERDALSRASGDLVTAIDTSMTSVEAREVVTELLKRIPDAQRRTVALRYLNDLTEVRAAEVLGVAVGTIKSTAARGLHRMRTLSALDDAA
jgi:RNA polymerase sigma factor (sigma-70 family)